MDAKNASSGAEERAFSPAVHEQVRFVRRISEALGVDDYMIAALIGLQIQNSEMLDKQQEILGSISDERGGSTSASYPIEMSHTVPSNTPVDSPVETARTPGEENFTRINGVILGWPSGTDNGAGIKLRTGDGLKLIPRNPQDDFIAFDDFSEKFDVDHILQPGEGLVAETVNLDSNDHFLNIVPQIEELTPERARELAPEGMEVGE